MKVIKDGRLAKQVICSYCGCIYEYNGKDVHYFVQDIRLTCDENAERKYVECPQCGEIHYLKNQGEK